MSALITIFLIFLTCTMAMANDYCEKCEIAKGTIAPGEKAYKVRGIIMDKEQASIEVCRAFGLSMSPESIDEAPGSYYFEFYLKDLIGNDPKNRKNPDNKTKFTDFWTTFGKDINCGDLSINENICPTTGGNPLFCSARTFSANAITLLIFYGIKGDLLNVPNPKDGKTVLDFAEQSCIEAKTSKVENSDMINKCTKIVDLLIKNGAKRSSEIVVSKK